MKRKDDYRPHTYDEVTGERATQEAQERVDEKWRESAMSDRLRQHIINMMTLRYDPLDVPTIRLREWEDFLPEKSEGTEAKVFELVRRKIEDKVIGEGYDKVTIALSGGVDSTFILSILRKVSKEVAVRAVCANFGDSFDETEKAKRIADIHDCAFKSIEITDPLANLSDLVGIVGEPRWNLYFYYVLQEAAKDSELMLTGDGGDELFGGYTFRYSKFLSNLKTGDTWHNRTANYLACHERDWVADQEHLFGENIAFNWDAIYGLFRRHFDNPLPPIDQVMLSDFNGKLAFDWIPTNKKLSEHLGVECYAPLLEEDIMRLATHIPNTRKFDPTTKKGKMVLREGLQNGLLIGDEKIGFGMDLAAMWQKTGKAWVDRYLGTKPIVVRRGIINEEWLRNARTMAEEEKSLRYINKLFSILSLEFWLKQCPSLI